MPSIRFLLFGALLAAAHGAAAIEPPTPTCIETLASQSSDEVLRRIEAWDPKTRVLVVVDGYSDGARFAVECRSRFPDVKIIHYQSSAHLPPAAGQTFDPTSYDEVLTHDPATFAELVAVLGRFRRNPLRVVAGSETGVPLADSLSSETATLSNGTAFSEARRDKSLMERAVAKRWHSSDRVQAMPSVLLENPEDVAGATQNTLSFPMALKPATSAGNFGFTVVTGREELSQRANELLTLTDPLGLPVRRVLLQPYKPGVVLAPNITRHPLHGSLFNELWETRVELRGTQIVFLRTRLVRFDRRDPLHRRLADAAGKVGDGLRIQWGPLHPEFLFTPDGMLYFIDAGARPAGGTLTAVAQRLGALDQITATLLAAFHPRAFRRAQQAGPTLEKEGALVYFASSRRGRVLSVPTEAEMRARIPGFAYAHTPKLHPGAVLGVSGNLFEQPGFVVVEGDVALQDAAEAAVRQWENEDFYRLEPVPEAP